MAIKFNHVIVFFNIFNLTFSIGEPNSREAVKLLESHGISFLPVDNSTLLTSALESGQSISLTGKICFASANLSKLIFHEVLLLQYFSFVFL